jgi:hypothetical protein
MKKIASFITIALLATCMSSAQAFRLGDIATEAGRQIPLQQRQQCINNCGNDGMCMQGCAAAYPLPNQQPRVDIACMTTCAEAGSSMDFCRSHCSY